MNLVGEKVTHKQYGKGVVVQQDDSYISIKFDVENQKKQFLYPSCFQSFLKLTNKDVADQMAIIIRKKTIQDQKRTEQQKEFLDKIRTSPSPQNNSVKREKTIAVPHFKSVSVFCDEYKKAISSEIGYLRANGGKRQRVVNGRRIEFRNGRYVYTFEADEELTLPDGIQINIFQMQANISGKVVGCEGFSVIIASSIDLGREVPSIEFYVEPWRLLNSLIDRLDKLSVNPSPIVEALVCQSYKAIECTKHTIISGQKNALSMSQTQPVTFVWGPPGTGKTETLAKIALKHIGLGHRVLMLSYSNVSVDGAILRVNKLAPESSPGILVRYGYPRSKTLIQHEYMTSYNLALHTHPTLKAERESLQLEQKTVSKSSQRYIDIMTRLAEIRNSLSEQEKKCVRAAKFVATTVSKAVVDSVVYNGEFDVVIFDEASMAYIPQVIFSASLAKKHFICMGDFRQLPPIVQSSRSSILSVDIFQYCGIATAVDRSLNHKWLCMLATQYRMHPSIADFASQTMYAGKLCSAKGMEASRQNIANKAPISGHALAFADLSGMMSVCTKTTDNSRINVLSAMMSFSLALEAAKENEVGIITPYRAQSRLLHAMVRDIMKTKAGLNPISCATVHQFQGSEKDIIIYDAVDCYRMPYPSILLTSSNNNYANRLFNVALTRAKGKFIAVANIDYMDNKRLSDTLIFKKLMKTQKGRPSCINGQKLSQARKLSFDDAINFFDSQEASARFLNDIKKARREIRIDIPSIPVNSDFIKTLIEALQSAKSEGIKVHIRVENRMETPIELAPLAVENHLAVNPISLIDQKIIWFGVPNSNAKFQSQGMILQTKYRPIIRFQGEYTARSLYNLTNMDDSLDHSRSVRTDDNGNPITETFASYIFANKKCKKCGKPMRLSMNQKRNFYISCTGYPECKTVEVIDVDLVQQYFYRHGIKGQRCPRCKFSLEAKMGTYGLYIQCGRLPPHKFKLNEI